MDMLLTVSGPPGSGTSSTAAALADRFGFSHTSGGDIFRDVATERGLTLEELNARAEEDPSIDRELDERLHRIARKEDDLVLESRLAGWLAGPEADFRIWLEAPLPVRTERIAKRESIAVDTAREKTVTRQKSERTRYEDYYSIDITDLSIYDISISTARWGEEKIPTVLADAIEAYDPAADEGQASVDIDF